MSCPLSAKHVAQSSLEVTSSVETKIVNLLVEDTNTQLMGCTLRNLDTCTVSVPRFVFGYPVFDAQKVAVMLSDAFKAAGFDVTVDKVNLTVFITWSASKTTT